MSGSRSASVKTMEEQAIERAGTAGSDKAQPVAWRDLREWIALIEANGLLKRIDKPVDADEELAAIAYLDGLCTDIHTTRHQCVLSSLHQVKHFFCIRRRALCRRDK